MLGQNLSTHVSPLAWDAHDSRLLIIVSTAAGAFLFVLAGGSKPQPMQARHINKPEDSLSSHVAAAQARANHIVEEFESMLLVTGGHSAKEIQAIQSQAGLGVSEQSKPVHSQGRFTRLTPARSDMSAQALNVPVKKGGIQQTSVDCACGLSSSSHSSIDVGKKDAAGTSSRTSAKTSSRKSTVKALKENKAPSLTYVSGSQVRGARRPHDFVSKHVLKPRVTDNHRATEQRHVAISTHLAYTSRSHNTTCL